MHQLKVNCVNHVRNQINVSNNSCNNLEQSVNALSHRLKNSTDNLSNTKITNTQLFNDTSKLEYLSARVRSEVNQMSQEIDLTKQQINQVTFIYNLDEI